MLISSSLLVDNHHPVAFNSPENIIVNKKTTTRRTETVANITTKTTPVIISDKSNGNKIGELRRQVPPPPPTETKLRAPGSLSSNITTVQTSRNHHNQQQRDQNCALLFFGLPRSYTLLVLPTIIQNILIPNYDNRCDIFVHFYLVSAEKDSRSGSGGFVDTAQILQLQDAVNDVYSNDTSSLDRRIPIVSIINDTELSFHHQRGQQLEKYRNTRDKDGKYLYYPWMAKSYTYPTTIDNIVKQWHSIDKVWNLMEETATSLGKNYTRVAMLRNDVVYVTPFDIYKRGINTPIDKNNSDVIVPNWARFPVNDRMIYGPHDGVKIWATERFGRLEDHVLTYEEAGYGMHSERFLEHSIFPAIRSKGYGFYQDLDICFFRTRVDGSTWINDCATRNGAAAGFRYRIDTQKLVQDLVGHECVKSKFNKHIDQLHCGDNVTSTKSSINQYRN